MSELVRYCPSGEIIRPQDAKIITFEEAADIIHIARINTIPTMVTTGIFDLVHPGHINFLKAAKDIVTKNGLLVVGLESDETARQNKGPTRPFIPLLQRLQFIAELESVDLVFGFHDCVQYTSKNTEYCKDLYNFQYRYSHLSPDYFGVLQSDPNITEKQVLAEQAGSQLAVIDLTKEYSTTWLAKLLQFE